jgi:hypothetical protein
VEDWLSERERILSLTTVAFLDAIILSLLGIQFVIPVSFVALLVLIPVIYGLQVYRIPLGLSLSSGLTLIIIGTGFFGIAVGTWMGLYVVVGLVVGLGRRSLSSKAGRILISTAAFTLGLSGIGLLFTLWAKLDFTEVMSVLERVPLLPPVFILSFFGFTIVTWSFIMSLGVESILSKIISQLYLNEKEATYA